MESTSVDRNDPCSSGMPISSVKPLSEQGRVSLNRHVMQPPQVFSQTTSVPVNYPSNFDSYVKPCIDQKYNFNFRSQFETGKEFSFMPCRLNNYTKCKTFTIKIDIIMHLSIKIKFINEKMSSWK